MGFVLKTFETRMVLVFILHKGNKVAKSHGRFLEGKITLTHHLDTTEKKLIGSHSRCNINFYAKQVLKY